MQGIYVVNVKYYIVNCYIILTRSELRIVDDSIKIRNEIGKNIGNKINYFRF